MTKTEILEKLKSMIAEQLGVDADSVKENTDIIKELGADSLDLVEMLMNVESEWNIEVADEDVSDMVTVGDVVNYIAEKIA